MCVLQQCTPLVFLHILCILLPCVPVCSQVCLTIRFVFTLRQDSTASLRWLGHTTVTKQPTILNHFPLSRSLSRTKTKTNRKTDALSHTHTFTDTFTKIQTAMDFFAKAEEVSEPKYLLLNLIISGWTKHFNVWLHYIALMDIACWEGKLKFKICRSFLVIQCPPIKCLMA